MKKDKSEELQKITLSITTEDYKLFKIVSLVEKRSMSAILTELIRKKASKIDLSTLISSKPAPESDN